MKDKNFRGIVGELLWIARNSRPDIAHAVNSLARVAHAPKPAHWRALQHLGRYLGSTKSHALELRREGPDPGVVVYTDADYAPKYGTAFDNYRSTSGYVGYFGRSAISWRSRRQQVMATSSAESEYYAAAAAAKEAVRLRGLYSTLYSISKPATLRIDNKSALQQAMDPVSLDASKHIDLRAHFLRERARDRVVLPEYVDTTTNWADGMTKSQPVSTFLRFANEVCVTAAPSTPRSD